MLTQICTQVKLMITQYLLHKFLHTCLLSYPNIFTHMFTLIFTNSSNCQSVFQLAVAAQGELAFALNLTHLHKVLYGQIPFIHVLVLELLTSNL